MSSDGIVHPELTYEIQRQIDEAHWNPAIQIEKTEDINTGYCRAFAANVYREITDLDVDIICLDGVTGTHYWLRVDGRHYDAETPKGVEDIARLPYWEDHQIPNSRISVVNQSALVESGQPNGGVL